jgi:hypothetical protein
MHAIANDHMYTNSLLKPQKKDDVLRTGDDEMPSEDHNSETESTFSSEAESSAYYDKHYICKNSVDDCVPYVLISAISIQIFYCSCSIAPFYI